MNPLADAQTIYVDIYSQFLESVGRSSSAARTSATQSWKSASGNFFQEYVRQYINTAASLRGLNAVNASELRRIDAGRESGQHSLIEFLQLPAKRRCRQSAINVWPDNDVILLTRSRDGIWRAMGIVSCKTSLQERMFESAFWTLATRDTGLRS